MVLTLLTEGLSGALADVRYIKQRAYDGGGVCF